MQIMPEALPFGIQSRPRRRKHDVEPPAPPCSDGRCAPRRCRRRAARREPVADGGGSRPAHRPLRPGGLPVTRSRSPPAPYRLIEPSVEQVVGSGEVVAVEGRRAESGERRPPPSRRPRVPSGSRPGPCGAGAEAGASAPARGPGARRGASWARPRPGHSAGDAVERPDRFDDPPTISLRGLRRRIEPRQNALRHRTRSGRALHSPAILAASPPRPRRCRKRFAPLIAPPVS